jgi:hypothetical protein
VLKKRSRSTITDPNTSLSKYAKGDEDRGGLGGGGSKSSSGQCKPDPNNRNGGSSVCQPRLDKQGGKKTGGGKEKKDILNLLRNAWHKLLSYISFSRQYHLCKIELNIYLPS